MGQDYGPFPVLLGLAYVLKDGIDLPSRVMGKHHAGLDSQAWERSYQDIDDGRSAERESQHPFLSPRHGQRRAMQRERKAVLVDTD